MKQEGNTFSNIIALLICGLGVGWLLGLATTPVLNIVLTSLIAAIAAIVTVLMRLPREPEKEPGRTHSLVAPSSGATVLPLAIIVFGVAVGATAGLTAREHRWFTPQLVEPNQGIDTTAYSTSAPGFFNAQVSRSECDELKDVVNDQDLLPQQMRTKSRLFRAAASKTQDHKVLELVVDLLCSSTH